MSDRWITCPDCEGTGEVDPPFGDHACPTCDGIGQVRDNGFPPLLTTRHPAEIPVWDKKTKTVHFVPNPKGGAK